MDHLVAIVVMALGSYGLWVAMGEGMVLEKYRLVIEKYFPVWMQMPLATCPRCMVTILGSLCALVALYLPGPFCWIAYIPCAVALQEFLDRDR